MLERDADLVDYLNEPGVEMDAKVSEELLVSLFLPDSENKLHDGAVIIKNLRIAQAGAVLPLSANAKLDKALGTRHRAAIGITEETDAVVVVVSRGARHRSRCASAATSRAISTRATLRKALLGLFQKQKRRAQSQKSKEREVPAALVELPFEKPQPPEEAEVAPTASDPEAPMASDPEVAPMASDREASAVRRQEPVEAKPAESS